MNCIPAFIAVSIFFDRLILTKHFRCFATQGADGAADVLQALSQSTQLEELIFRLCCHIPTAAWQKVRSAKWLNLKKADLSECLARRNGWGFSCFLRVFICLCWKLLEFRFIVRIGKLSHESELTKMCLKWVTVNLELLPSSHFFQQIDSDKTLQVLQWRHERSRWSRRSSASLEPVVPAGRVEFCRLFADPNRGVAKSSWCQVAELEEGSFRRVPRFFFSAFLSLLLDVVRVQICIDLWSCRMSWNDLEWPGYMHLS